MGTDDARHLAQLIVDTQYDGGSSLSPDGSLDEDNNWGIWKDQIPTIIRLSHDRQPQLRITCGVAWSIPGGWSPQLFEAVSDLNSNLFFGRSWAIPMNDDLAMCIVMQEIIPASLVSLVYEPSIEYVQLIILSLRDASNRWAPILFERCGGTSWPDLFALAVTPV